MQGCFDVMSRSNLIMLSNRQGRAGAYLGVSGGRKDALNLRWWTRSTSNPRRVPVRMKCTRSALTVRVMKNADTEYLREESSIHGAN